VRILANQAQRFDRVGHGSHLAAEILQKHGHEADDAGFIVDDHDTAADRRVGTFLRVFGD